VLWSASGLAPTLPRPVVDTDAGCGGHTWLDPPCHHHARLAEARFEDDRRRARAHATDIEAVPSDVEQPAWHGMRRPVLCFADRLVSGARRGEEDDSCARIPDHVPRPDVQCTP